MKRNNKKGFTITELVIVIAVIAILAAVLIPTFSGVIDKAKKSTATQECAQARQNLLVEKDADLSGYNWYFIHEEGYAYSLINGVWEEYTITNLTAITVSELYLSVENADGKVAADKLTTDYLPSGTLAADMEDYEIVSGTACFVIADLSDSVVIIAEKL